MDDGRPTRLPTDELEPRSWHLATWFYALLYALSRKREVQGVSVAALKVGDHDQQASLRSVDEALQLISEHDPRCFARLQKHVRSIWVGPIPNYARGQWIEDLRMCMLRDSYVSSDETSVAHVASIIVHESTHAWLEQAGFGYDERVRARVERICIRSQLAFARKHPDGARLIEALEERLARDDAWWSDARLRNTQLGVLEEMGTPGWFRRMIDRMTRNRPVGPKRPASSAE
jgi:hypothetical protein